MDIQKLFINEIRSYLLIYKTTCIFYDIGIIDSDADDFLATLQQVSINNDTYTDDVIIKEVINKFQKKA